MCDQQTIVKEANGFSKCLETLDPAWILRILIDAKGITVH